ncbi:MAG TPA: hypothetical protein VOA88_08440 [Candidatus Dormibacteraeota bacterium]|nr:hypothetical protein [Candidatus Dormibacteraeota bacterium]
MLSDFQITHLINYAPHLVLDCISWVRRTDDMTGLEAVKLVVDARIAEISKEKPQQPITVADW